MSNQKKFFYVSAICSCCLSLYLATYLTLLSFIAVALSSVTFLLIFKIESIKEQKDWKKKEFFKYFLVVTLAFHITSFYNTSAEICYLADKKDQLFVDFDSFVLGKFFPKGQISLWLDTHPTLNPQTSLGVFFNTIFVISYFGLKKFYFGFKHFLFSKMIIFAIYLFPTFFNSFKLCIFSLNYYLTIFPNVFKIILIHLFF